MTPEEADRVLDAIWSRMPADTHKVADVIADAFHVGIPMMVRVAAMARLCGTVSGAVYKSLCVPGEISDQPILNPAMIYRVESIPDIVTMLRAAADLLEASHKPKADG